MSKKLKRLKWNHIFQDGIRHDVVIILDLDSRTIAEITWSDGTPLDVESYGDMMEHLSDNLELGHWRGKDRTCIAASVYAGSMDILTRWPMMLELMKAQRNPGDTECDRVFVNCYGRPLLSKTMVDGKLKRATVGERKPAKMPVTRRCVAPPLPSSNLPDWGSSDREPLIGTL